MERFWQELHIDDQREYEWLFFQTRIRALKDADEWHISIQNRKDSSAPPPGRITWNGTGSSVTAKIPNSCSPPFHRINPYWSIPNRR